MTNIVMYKTTYCPYCTKAKSFLSRKGKQITQEIDVTTSDDLRIEMMEKSGGRKTVPQIFINNTHVGGYDDMVVLDESGKLEALF